MDLEMTKVAKCAMVSATAFIFTTACSPTKKLPSAPSPSPNPAHVIPAPTIEPPYVYYRMVRVGHLDLVMDEVRLDGESSRCFQAHRKLLGGFPFAQGKSTADRSAFSDQLEALTQSFKEWNKEPPKPTLVLHGYTDHDEADDEHAARELSRKRAEIVKQWLVQVGIPTNQIKINAHGWDLSPLPIHPHKELKPTGGVEIAADQSAPSHARFVKTDPVDAATFRALQKRIRTFEAKQTSKEASQHTPRVALVTHDKSDSVRLSFDLTSENIELMALHRYFITGLSNGCHFGALQ